MRNFIILITIFFALSSCKKNTAESDKLSEKSKSKSIDSLIFIKDTTIFSNSSEGEKISLFKNKTNNDSIIKSEIYGETGKSELVFVFNKRLLKANRLILNYEEPIYVNSTPKIINQLKENLKTSALVKNELISIFKEDILFFRTQTKSNKRDLILNKWEGIYYVSPYAIDSEKLGNYYLEIFKDYADFGFSGDNEFLFDIELIERGNKLYIFDKSKFDNSSLLKDAVAILTKVNGENFIQCKMIKMFRKDIKENSNGFLFKWKKTVKEVPDTPEEI